MILKSKIAIGQETHKRFINPTPKVDCKATLDIQITRVANILSSWKESKELVQQKASLAYAGTFQDVVRDMLYLPHP